MTLSEEHLGVEEEEVRLEAEGAVEATPTSEPDAVAGVIPDPAKRSKAGLIFAMTWLIGITLLAVLASWLPMAGPYVIPSPVHFLQAPGFRLHAPLGTDEVGRSELSRIIFGARASLEIGALSTLFGLIVGTTLGILAGYYGRAIDWTFGLFTSSMLAFPPLLFLLTAVAVLAASTKTLIGARAILAVPLFAPRRAGEHAVDLLNRDFIAAFPRSLGAQLRQDRVPGDPPEGVLLPMISYIGIVAATLIVAEGSISYLGLGVPPPTPSWGSMMADGFVHMSQDPWLVLLPALAFFFTVYSLNLVGDWARTRFGRGGVR